MRHDNNACFLIYNFSANTHRFNKILEEGRTNTMLYFVNVRPCIGGRYFRSPLT